MKVNVSSTKLKGTVLFTVVSVLMVLIVILLGTLALAATASNRAYQNYQKEQTEYTARALLDSVVAAVNADDSNDGIKSQIAGLGTEGDSIEIEIVRSDNTRHDAEGNPVPEVVTVTKLKSQYFYIEKIDPETSQPYGWKECNVYDLTTVISKTMADTTYSVKMTDMPVTTPSTDGGGGAFVSMGNAIVPDSGVITGGTAVGLNSDGSDTYPITNDPFTIEADAYIKGNLTVQNHSVFRFTNMGTHVAVTGDLGYGNSINWDFTESFNWDEHADKSTGTTSYQEIPCVYVGGRFYNMQNVTWNTKNTKGEGGHPINLYCGYLDFNGISNFYMTGDIYAFNEDQTSRIVTTNESALYKWTSKNIGFPGNKSNKQYQFGSFFSAGNALLQINDNTGLKIEGDCRVAKNLDLLRIVNVDGDLVVGDTLTIANGAKVTVKGDVYASKLINNGELICDGEIYVFDVLSHGAVTKNAQSYTITPASTAGLAANVKTVWIEDMTLTPVSESTPYQYSFSYTEYTKEGFDETSKVVSGTNPIAEVNGIMGPYWFNEGANPGMTIQDAVMQYDEKYKSYMDMLATQGQKKQVNTYDISSLYKQPIYPDGFTKDEILNDIIKESINYTPVKYQGYPQTVEEFEQNYGECGNVVYTSYADIKNKATNRGIITESCTLSGSWTASDDNIYIKANGKRIAIVIDGLSMDNGKSIIIDESNGGEVFFFINKDKSVNIMSGGALLTTDIIKKIDGNHNPGPGHGGPGPGGNKYTDEYFLKTNFTKLGFSSMKGPWEVQKYADPLYPDVYLFSGENASIHFPNASILSMNVRAPLLTFIYKSSGGQNLAHRIEYTASADDVRIYDKQKNGQPVQFAMLGQLIAGDIQVNNNFGMLHLAKDDPNAGNGNQGNGGSGVPEDIYTLFYNYY